MRSDYNIPFSDLLSRIHKNGVIGKNGKFTKSPCKMF